MKLAPVAWSLVAVVSFGGLARAQSLSDLAKKEEERRKAVKGPAKVYTNDDLKKYVPQPPPVPAGTDTAAPGPALPPGDQPAASDATKPDAAKADAAKPQPEQPKVAADDQVKDEAYWKNKINGARTKLERDQSYLEALQSRVNALTNDFYARDDPAQRAVIWTQRTKALEEMERLKKEIADGTKTIAQIQEDARRAGVPPGWLR